MLHAPLHATVHAFIAALRTGSADLDQPFFSTAVTVSASTLDRFPSRTSPEHRVNRGSGFQARVDGGLVSLLEERNFRGSVFAGRTTRDGPPGRALSFS
jgi:hypothetical protein